MNPNIEVINENLWVVNFQYVGMGYIRELTFNDYDSAIKNGVVLTEKGQLVVNSSDGFVMKYLFPVMKVVMGFPNNLLHSDKGFCIYIKAERPKLDHLKNANLIKLLKDNDCYTAKRNLFESVCKWESERRKLKKKEGE